jgi:hypothetical protein
MARSPASSPYARIDEPRSHCHFRLITDPFHSWLEVPLRTFKAMRLIPSDFSDCSYIDRNACYLEMDWDGPKFIAIYQRKYKRRPHIIETRDKDYCFVRTLSRIHP